MAFNFTAFFIITFLAVGIKTAFGITNVYVGIISGPEDDSRQNNPRFWSSNDTRIQLHPNSQDIPWWGSRQVTIATCALLESGVHIIVSGAPYFDYRVLQSYSSRFHVPMITTRAPNRLFGASNLQISMMPNSAKAIADLMQNYEWKSFIYFYDNDEGPYILENILEASEHRIEVEAMWRVSSGEEAQRFLQWLRPANESSKEGVLLSTREHLVDGIISTLSYGTALKRWFHFIVTDPVGIVEEGGRYEAQGSFKITKLSLGNAKNPTYLELENRWNTLLAHRRRPITLKVIPTSALLLRDAAYILTTATRSIPLDVPSFNMTPQSVKCMEGDTPAYVTSHATALTNLMKKVAFPNGKSGNLRFTQNGERDEYSFEITETTPLLVRKIGTWSKRLGLRLTDKPKLQQDQTDYPRVDKRRDVKPKYIITTVLTVPFLWENSTDESLGNDRFHGFVKDLMEALCNTLGCDYELRIVRDGTYGIKKIDTTQTPPREYWSGMIGDVINEEADMAVAPLTITSARRQVVDFSKPIMDVGLSMLIKKPAHNLETSYIGVLGFLSVWSYGVWLMILLAYGVIGAMNFAVSNYTEEPERIRSLDTKLSDRLSVASSYWFAFSSLFFRETGIYPRSVSHRLLSIVWWLFSLTFLAFYTSSLASMLIVARTTTQTTHSFMRASDVLKSAVEKGYPAVGAVKGGSTHAFFMNSEIGLYKEYGKYLLRHPEVLNSGYRDGVERVRNSGGGYAMITESSSAEYLSNIEPCDVMVTSGYLDHKSYGIALKKGSALRETIDHALIELTEAGVLRNLYEKFWYHEKRCEDPYMNILPSVYSNFLTLEEVSGVFYLLIIGVVIAVAAGTFDHFRQSNRISVDN